MLQLVALQVVSMNIRSFWYGCRNQTIVTGLYQSHTHTNCCLSEKISVRSRNYCEFFSKHIASKPSALFVQCTWRAESCRKLAFNLFYCQQLWLSCSQQNAYLYWISRKIVAQKLPQFQNTSNSGL